MAIHVINEAKRCLNCKKPMCREGCPIHTPIPDMIHTFLEGDINQAGEMVFENNPLSIVCSLICNHENQCEGHCVLNRKGSPVHISSIENYISENYFDKLSFSGIEKNGLKAGIIGSGPAGITIAVILAQRGYDITIFESREKIGGVLRYGIPEFRLPKSIVQKEVDTLKALGVKVETNMVIGRVISIDELMDDMGFEAVFIGSGAGLPRFMKIPGENLCGVYSANEFLTRTNLMKSYKEDSATPIMHAKKVAIVGGGNVAMDAARCAKRLGADEVYIVYRRSEEELPARREEVEHAKEEGIIFKLLNNPVEILGDENEFVTGMKCVEMELGEPDESGRRRPVVKPGSEFVLDVDAVVISIGTSPNPLIKATTKGLETQKWGGIITDEHGLTSREGVYAGGDAVTGAATVILAMGAGKTAAAAIDEYIKSKE